MAVKALIKDGKPKVEAAMAIFAKLKGADRETVVQAFIDGAGLTEKGAVTYWYNYRAVVLVGSAIEKLTE